MAAPAKTSPYYAGAEEEEDPKDEEMAGPPEKPGAKEFIAAFTDLVRAGSSTGNWARKYEQLDLPGPPPQPVWRFPLESFRMAALYRMLRQLATRLVGAGRPTMTLKDMNPPTKSISDVFLFTRCSVRYKDSLMKHDPSKDEEALLAGSEQDTIMIHCIEDCCIRVGYAILRALAIVREYGSPTAQQMGIFAILHNQTTAQPFLELTNAIYIDCQHIIRTKYAADVMLKQHAQHEEVLIKRFANLNFAGVCDITAIDRVNYPLFPHPAVYEDELAQEQAFYRQLPEFTPVLRYSRLQKQAALYLSAVTPFRPRDPSAPTVQEQAAHHNMHIRRLRILAAEGSDLDLQKALGEGKGLSAAALEVLQGIATALECEAPTLFTAIQSDFVTRMRFVEAVMLRHALNEAAAHNSDARPALLKMTCSMLQSNYDFIVLHLKP
jgi:hypothetical protein